MTEGRLGMRDHWLFADATSEELAPLENFAQEVHFQPGQVIFREGDVADGLYLITAGVVRVAASNAHGEIEVATAQRDSVLGEMGVLDGEPRSGTATAVGLCAASYLPADVFLDLLERSPRVCMRLLAVLARKLRCTNGPLAEFAGGSPLRSSTEA